MKRFAAAIAVTVLTVSLVLAQDDAKSHDAHKTDKGAKGEMVTLKGYVVDENCASGDAGNLSEAAASHTIACSIKCGASGETLGLIADGKWYSFDAKGTKKALKMLKKAKSEKGVMAEVTGTLEGNTLMVSSIKEVESAS